MLSAYAPQPDDRRPVEGQKTEYQNRTMFFEKGNWVVVDRKARDAVIYKGPSEQVARDILKHGKPK